MSKHFWRGFFGVFIPAMATFETLIALMYWGSVIINNSNVRWYHAAWMTANAAVMWYSYSVFKKGNP